MERVAGRDAIFLYADTPRNHMHMAFAGVLDPSTVPGGAPEPGDMYPRLYDLLEERLHLFPPFRQRLVDVPFGLHHPVFIDDPDFELGNHLRRAALPAPGGKRELQEFVADLASRPMDRSRPLWEMHVVEGIEGGRWALVAKAHHVIVDGIGGNEILVNLLDLTPEVREVDPPERPWEPDEEPSELRLLASAVVENLKQPPRMVKAAGKLLGTVGGLLVEQARGGDDGAIATLGPQTRLNGRVSGRRSVAFGQVPLDDVKRVKDAFGVKVNDVVLAICGRAVRRYLVESGEDPERELVAAVPISIRTADDDPRGNRVAGMTAPLADNVDDPGDQLRRIADVTTTAKDRLGAVTADILTDWTEFATPALAAQAFRFYSRTQLSGRGLAIANLTISNVPGPDIPLYVAGSELRSMYPLGPVVHGQALNITVVSYRGTMYVGAIGDRERVPDVGRVVAGVEKALAELLAAAEERRS